MNKTKIEVFDYTWNPVVGCTHACGQTAVTPAWCYAMGQARRQRKNCERCYRFEPHFHDERLQEPYHVRKPSMIFADSMSDLYCMGVRQAWRDEVYTVMTSCAWHTFFVLTKAPNNIDSVQKPANLWLGVSVTKQGDVWRIDELRKRVTGHKFVFFEPLHGHIQADLEGIEWVVIGAETGRRKDKIVPDIRWIRNVVHCAGYSVESALVPISVFIKDNMLDVIDLSLSLRQYRQFPEGVTKRFDIEHSLRTVVV